MNIAHHLDYLLLYNLYQYSNPMMRYFYVAMVQKNELLNVMSMLEAVIRVKALIDTEQKQFSSKDFHQRFTRPTFVKELGENF